jgi:Histidine kinase-like ATPase domain
VPRRAYPGEERQLGPLRKWIKSLLTHQPALDDVLVVAAELASNATKHTASGQGRWFIVEMTCHPRMVRVAIADCGAPNEPKVIDDALAESKRGLVIVRALAVRTGVCGDQRSRLVWADIACGHRTDSEPSVSTHVPPVSWPQFPLLAAPDHRSASPSPRN